MAVPSTDEAAEIFLNYLAELWKVHLFREGLKVFQKAYSI